MFQVIVEWRGTLNAIGQTDGSTEAFLDDQGNEVDYRPTQVQLTSFQPLFRKINLEQERSSLSELFTRKSQPRTLSESRTRIYYMAPEAWRNTKTGEPCGLAQRSMCVDVPFEAMQKLSVVAQRSGLAVDLTLKGQEDICRAFAEKVGIFASDDDETGGVIDPFKSADENDTRGQKIIDAVAPKREWPIK